jgi:transcriptional regulator with XRE-family HTH domain
MEAGKNINERILQIRKALELSQKAFADRIKVSRTYQSAFESSGNKINDRIITLICMTYGVNESWLRNGTGEAFKTPSNPRLEQALQNFEKLDTILQDYFLKQIDLLLEIQEKKKLQNQEPGSSAFPTGYILH